MKENNKKSTDISSDDVSGHFKIGNSHKKIHFKQSPFSLLHTPKHANNFSEILFQLSARFAAIKANGRRGKTRAD